MVLGQSESIFILSDSQIWRRQGFISADNLMSENIFKLRSTS